MTEPQRAESPATFGDKLETLVANGYHPLPIVPADRTFRTGGHDKPGGKAPGRLRGTLWFPMAGWEQFEAEPPSLAQCRRWAAWPDHGAGEPGIGGALGGPENLTGADVDTLHEKLAEKAARLAEKHFGAAPMRIGRAPKRLYLVRCTERIRKRKSKTWVLDGVQNVVEVLAAGQQSVIDGVHPDTGRPYQWYGGSPFEVPVAELPLVTPETVQAFLDEFDEVCAAHGAEVAAGASQGGVRSERPVEELTANSDQVLEALEYLPAEAAEAYDDWIKIGMALRSATRNHEDQTPVVEAWHDFSAKAEGAYDPVEAQAKWDSFDPDRITDVGSWTIFRAAQRCDWDGPRGPEPEDEFGAVPEALAEPERRGPIEEAVAKVNDEFAVVLVGGKTLVLQEAKRSDGRRQFADFMGVQDFKHWLADQRVFDPTAGKAGGKRPVADVWMQHPERRKYRGVTFDPGGAPADVYNLWTGWAVEPDPAGSCDRFLKHLHANVARGNDALYRWIVGWFAHMVQRPSVKPGTALVLRGKQGTGKSIVGNVIGALFPAHHTTVSAPKHVTGAFNAHMSRTLLLQAEEAFWAGSKDAAGVLKDLVTGGTMQLERKGIDPIQVKSVLRLLVTSNEEWVVPAAAEERRFAVIDVGDARAQDLDYFRAIMEELDAGGYGALLHHLQTFDLATVDVGRIPKTEGLLDQKLQSLDSVTQFWFECLRDGAVPGAHEFDGGWPDEVPRRGLLGAYHAGVKERRLHTNRSVDEAQFGKQLRILSPGIRDVKRRRDGGQVRLYVLPPLEDCRAQFEAWIGHSVPWEDDEAA